MVAVHSIESTLYICGVAELILGDENVFDLVGFLSF